MEDKSEIYVKDNIECSISTITLPIKNKKHVKRNKTKTATIYFLYWFFLAFVQTSLFGVLLILSERLDALYLFVTIFNPKYIYKTELALVFFYLFLPIDIICEFFRYVLRKYFLGTYGNTIKTSLIVSIIQTFFFFVVNFMLSQVGIFGVNFGSHGYIFPDYLFYIVLFVLILLTEIVGALIRRLFKLGPDIVR